MPVLELMSQLMLTLVQSTQTFQVERNDKKRQGRDLIEIKSNLNI